MSSDIDIEQIKRDLVKLDAELSPSDAHGTLCGLLCGRSDIDVQEWLSLVVQGYDRIAQGDLLAQEASVSLELLFKATTVALADNSLKFYPLLPEYELLENELPEEKSKIIRLEAIAEWAQGYLMGLSQAGLQSFSNYPEEVAEFVEAMAAISNAHDYELSGDDSDEEAIIELIEFIRMGVLLMNEEMNPVRVPVDIPANNAIH